MLLDTILENAHVVTLDEDRPKASRVGIWKGRIAGIDGDLDGLSAREVVDLGGATVLPGFIDAHTHLQLTGQSMLAVDIASASTPEQALDLIAAGSAGMPAEAWVEVSGYDQRAIGRDLTNRELDHAGGGRKVWARHTSSHSSVVSSAVLDAASDPTLREDTDVAAGLLKEGNQRLVREQRLPYTLADAGRAVTTAVDAAQREGITFCMEAGAGGEVGSLNPLDVSTYLELLETAPLPVRIQLMPSWDAVHRVTGGEAEGFGRGIDLGVRTGFGNDALHIGAMKFLLDGGMAVRTAYLTEPYEGTQSYGEMRDDPDGFIDQMVDAHTAGWQLAVHAIGDAALDVAIRGFRAALAKTPSRGHRHRIEHGGLIRDDQIAPLADMGITVVSQPGFLYDSGDDYVALIGSHREPWLYRGRSLLDAGVRLVGSTDRPLKGTPLRVIQTFVERRSNQGTAICDRDRITVAEALASVTTEAAWIAGMEDRLGRVRPGFLADLTVLDANPLITPVEQIAAIPVRATVMGGRLLEVST